MATVTRRAVRGQAAALGALPRWLLLWTAIAVAPLSPASENTQASDELRARLFALDPAEIGITRDKLVHPVWGMIMETGLDTGSFTLLTLADGTTSIYFSNGGGTVGAGEYQSVRDAVGHYLSGAQYFYDRAEPVENTPRPAAGQVIFYFLSFDGISAYAAPEDELGGGNDPLSNLFFAAHGVIEAVRKLERQ